MTTTTMTPSRPRRSPRWLAIGLLAVVAIIATVVLPTTSPAADAQDVELRVYDDALSDGFQDWSWAAIDLASTDRATTGSNSIKVDFFEWDALQLGYFDGLDVPTFGELAFDVHGGSNGNVTFNVAMLDTGFAAGPAQQVDVPGGEWTAVSIPLPDLGGYSRIGGMWWQEGTGGDPAPIWIDNVRIIAGDAPPPVDGPELRVDLDDYTLVRSVTDPSSGATSQVATDFPRPISEGIYGMNFASNSLREELDLGVNRWGGNSTERYNYLTNSWNAGADWVFANVIGNEGDSLATFESATESDGTESIVTIPATGWVSADRTPDCSYPVDEFGDQDTVFTVQDDTTAVQCGNGEINGEKLPSVDPLTTSIPADETFAAEMVQSLVDQFGPASSGGVEIYAVGNEPGLWHSTHRDIRPDPIGRDEIVDRNTRWSQAIKSVDPSADVIGPVLWSGYSYFVTSEEILSGQQVTDVSNFSADYLARMADASASAGTRLLDQFAVNFYDERVFLGGTDEMRLDATRSLWDSTYVPDDWWVIRDWARGPYMAIPRLRAAIDENYPGTKLAITEYNFGGENTIGGALAQIDALGIFGREGVDTATIWDPFLGWVGLSESEHSNRPQMHAFRMFRNYDGEGGRYGDTALWAESSDEPTVSVFAAERSSDGALTILVNNKSTVGQNVPLEVAVSGTAKAYQYSAADLSGIVRIDDVTVNGGALLELPARSATLLVIEDPGDPTVGDPPTPPPTPNPTPQPEPGDAELPVVGDGAALIDAPADMREGRDLDSADTSYIWLEKGPAELGRDYTINAAEPGRYRGKQSADVALPAGTVLCSFRVSGDHLADNGELTGSATWRDTEILGVVYRAPAMRVGAFLNAPGTTNQPAGMEGNDRIDLTDNSVSWRFRLGRGIDSIRILTAC